MPLKIGLAISNPLLRMHAVDDQVYHHAGVYIFYLSWPDSQAYYAVQNATAAVEAGTGWRACACLPAPRLLCLLCRLGLGVWLAVCVRRGA